MEFFCLLLVVITGFFSINVIAQNTTFSDKSTASLITTEEQTTTDGSSSTFESSGYIFNSTKLSTDLSTMTELVISNSTQISRDDLTTSSEEFLSLTTNSISSTSISKTYRTSSSMTSNPVNSATPEIINEISKETTSGISATDEIAQSDASSFSHTTFFLLVTSPVATPVPLNVSSVIQMLFNAGATERLVALLNVTNKEILDSIADFALNQNFTIKEQFFNSTSGQLLYTLLQTNSSAILENYSTTLVNAENEVYFYAILLELLENFENEEFIDNFIEGIVANNKTFSYQLDSENISSIVCKIFLAAGGDSVECTPTTTPPITTTNAGMQHVGLIVGCTVAAGALLIVGIAAFSYFHSKSVKPKVSPTNDVETPRSVSVRNGFCENSQVSLRPSD